MSRGDTDCLAEAAPAEPSRLANVLRWLGTGAVASSGVVFLLQGLDGMDAAVRHWSYLALMGLLAACGVGTRALLGDARSARLLLGLAVMLVPIQFAQLGGMLHTLVTGEVTALVALFGLHTSSAWTVAAVAAATALAAPAATFAGFAVLVRPAARTLTWRFILPNTLLLLPWRDSAAGFAVLAVMAVLAPVTDRYLRSLGPHSGTGEGRAARALFLVPLGIASVRLAFHVEALAGYCLLAGFAAVALAYAARNHVGASAVREVMYLASTTLGTLAWSVWSFTELNSPGFTAAVMLVPAAGFCLVIGRLSETGAAYRLFAALLMSTAAVTLLTADVLAGALAALLLGVVWLVYGYLRRQREPALGGLLVTSAALVVLAARAWQQVDANGWVVLAVAGVLLVVGASLVERFGPTLAWRLRERWVVPAGNPAPQFPR